MVEAGEKNGCLSSKIRTRLCSALCLARWLCQSWGILKWTRLLRRESQVKLLARFASWSPRRLRRVSRLTWSIISCHRCWRMNRWMSWGIRCSQGISTHLFSAWKSIIRRSRGRRDWSWSLLIRSTLTRRRRRLRVLRGWSACIRSIRSCLIMTWGLVPRKLIADSVSLQSRMILSQLPRSLRRI